MLEMDRQGSRGEPGGGFGTASFCTISGHRGDVAPHLHMLVTRSRSVLFSFIRRQALASLGGQKLTPLVPALALFAFSAPAYSQIPDGFNPGANGWIYALA